MPMLSSRVPQEWRDEVEAIATKTGRKPSQVVYEALGQYLGRGSAESLSSRVERLEERVGRLEDG